MVEPPEAHRECVIELYVAGDNLPSGYAVARYDGAEWELPWEQPVRKLAHGLVSRWLYIDKIFAAQRYVKPPHP